MHLLTRIGLVMNNIAGTFIGCKIKVESVRNLEKTESLALLNAVIWEKEKGLKKMCFVSDAKTVIDSLNLNNYQVFWYNRSVLDDCKTISFDFVKFEFLCRNHIILADQAAKFSKRSRTSENGSEISLNFLSLRCNPSFF